MEELNKFLRVKRKSEYKTAIGRIKLTKKDKSKIKRFKNNRSVSEFKIERNFSTEFVCATREEPLELESAEVNKIRTPNEEKKRKVLEEKFLKKQRRRRKAIESQKRVENVEDLWEGREGESERDDGKLSRKTPKPTEADGYTAEVQNLATNREDIWRNVHFYRECVRRPRMARQELKMLAKKLEPPKIRVPEGMEIPTVEYSSTSYKENIRDVMRVACGTYYLAVHSSSISLEEREGYVAVRRMRIVSGDAEVLIRGASVSPNEKTVAVVTYEKGIVFFEMEKILSSTKEEILLDIEKEGEFLRIFGDRTFRKGAWHCKSVYFAAILHGQVVVVNTKKRKGTVFYKGDQKIQHVEFHPSRPLLLLASPSSVYFYSLVSMRRVTKYTVNGLSAANVVSISHGHGLVYVGTGTSQIHAYSMDKEFKTEFIRAVHVKEVPRKLAFHEKYGYVCCFNRMISVIVYANRNGAEIPPEERAGAIHKYDKCYRSGVFHEEYPSGVFCSENMTSLLYPKYKAEG